MQLSNQLTATQFVRSFDNPAPGSLRFQDNRGEFVCLFCLALIAGTSPRKSISARREQVPFSMAIGNMELMHVIARVFSQAAAHGNSEIEIRQ